MFPRRLEPIQDEKCQRRLPISGQYPNKSDEDYPYPWNTMRDLTKVTDKLIVHTPTMVNQPLIQDESKRRRGDVSRKHQ